MRATVAVINVGNLKHNIAKIRELAPHSSILAIVKANAYGHGILQMAHILAQEGVEFLGVAFATEGVMLRKAGITMPVVVLAPPYADEARNFCDYNLQAALSGYEFMYALSREAKQLGVNIKAHLCIGTGMNREGIWYKDALQFMKECVNHHNLEIIGAYTHFATSTSDPKFAYLQFERFNETINEMKKAGFEFQYLHAANSGAIANLPESHLNIIRPGIAIYGYGPANDLGRKLDLKPVMTLKTKVVLKFRIDAGESVSYERLFISDKPTNIVTLPVGYGDGYFKTLTNKAQCLIHGKRYNIVGSITMDECMVDMGDDEVNIGDEAILFGEQNGESIWADELAAKIGTITYEIITAISERVPRVYINEE